MINRTDPTGMQDVILDDVWQAAIEEAFERVYSSPTVRDFAEEVAMEVAERVGIPVTDDLVAASMQRISVPAVAARLNAVGIIVTSVIPVQQPNGLICNSWEYTLGLCDPVWDNPTTYQSIAPDVMLSPALSIPYSVLTEVDCLPFPQLQLSLAPNNTQTQITTLTQTDTNRESGILVSHYTSNEGADAILASNTIRIDAAPLLRESHVYVFEGRSTASRAAEAGAVYTEARIVFDAQQYELELDPEQSDRIRRKQSNIILEARRFIRPGNVSLVGRNACKETPRILGLGWTMCR